MVRVRIDEPGQHRQLREVDDLGARRNRDMSAPTCLIRSPSTRMIWLVATVPGLGIDQAAGPDRGDLLRARRRRPAAERPRSTA